MSKTQIKLCSSRDITRVMDYIETNWKSGHIMAHDQILVDFLHKEKNGEYNYYLAEKDERICGIIGFIPTSHYDPALEDNRCVWTVIWKSTGDPGIGSLLLKKILLQYDYVGAIGINSNVAKLYTLLHYQIGELIQYYIPNQETTEFKIASIPDPCRHCLTGGTEFLPLDQNSLNQCKVESVYYPKKSKQYFVNRYLKHPYYKYKLYAAVNRGESAVRAIFAIRAIDINDSRCLRIVDVLGDIAACKCLEEAFQKMLREEHAEYIDCLNYGLPQELFLHHGFEIAGPDRVIPNYFEPFVRDYVPIKFAVLNKTGQPFTVFKGDSDQDRPNIIPRKENSK